MQYGKIFPFWIINRLNPIWPLKSISWNKSIRYHYFSYIEIILAWNLQIYRTSSEKLLNSFPLPQKWVVVSLQRLSFLYTHFLLLDIHIGFPYLVPVIWTGICFYDNCQPSENQNSPKPSDMVSCQQTDDAVARYRWSL